MRRVVVNFLSSASALMPTETVSLSKAPFASWIKTTPCNRHPLFDLIYQNKGREFERLFNPEKDWPISDVHGQNLLDLSVLLDRVGILDFLLRQPASGLFLNLPTGIGLRTALMRAAQMGHVACAERLLDESYLDVNLQDQEGNTALHHAVEGATEGHSLVVTALAMDSLKQIKLVRNFGSLDWSLRNKAGDTVFSLSNRLWMEAHDSKRVPETELVKLVKTREASHTVLSAVFSKSNGGHFDICCALTA